MPIYQNVTPPIALSSGDVEFSFNNGAFPGSWTTGAQFALPSYAGLPDGGTSVRWQTIFGTLPMPVSIVLQAAMSDVDFEYPTIDTAALPAGEGRTVANVQAKFLRIRFVSSTGGPRAQSRAQLYRREAREDQSYAHWAYDLLDDAVPAFYNQPFVTISYPATSRTCITTTTRHAAILSDLSIENRRR